MISQVKLYKIGSICKIKVDLLCPHISVKNEIVLYLFTYNTSLTEKQIFNLKSDLQ